MVDFWYLKAKYHTVQVIVYPLPGEFDRVHELECPYWPRIILATSLTTTARHDTKAEKETLIRKGLKKETERRKMTRTVIF